MTNCGGRWKARRTISKASRHSSRSGRHVISASSEQSCLRSVDPDDLLFAPVHHRKHSMDIKGRVAIVSGSSSGTGVGGEIAKLLASRGCNVAVNYASNKAGAEEAVAACKAGGADAFGFNR